MSPVFFSPHILHVSWRKLDDVPFQWSVSCNRNFSSIRPLHIEECFYPFAMTRPPSPNSPSLISENIKDWHTYMTAIHGHLNWPLHVTFWHSCLCVQYWNEVHLTRGFEVIHEVWNWSFLVSQQACFPNQECLWTHLGFCIMQRESKSKIIY